MNSPATSYYEILGISRGAKPEDIRFAYQKRSRKFTSSSSSSRGRYAQLSAEDYRRLQTVTSAYQTLIDSRRRIEYDRTLPAFIPGWSNRPQEAEFRPASLLASRRASKQRMGVSKFRSPSVERGEFERHVRSSRASAFATICRNDALSIMRPMLGFMALFVVSLITMLSFLAAF